MRYIQKLARVTEKDAVGRLKDLIAKPFHG